MGQGVEGVVEAAAIHRTLSPLPTRTQPGVALVVGAEQDVASVAVVGDVHPADVSVEKVHASLLGLNDGAKVKKRGEKHFPMRNFFFPMRKTLCFNRLQRHFFQKKRMCYCSVYANLRYSPGVIP